MSSVVRLGDSYVCEKRRYGIITARFETMCRLCSQTASVHAIEEHKEELYQAMEDYCRQRYSERLRRANLRLIERGKRYKEGTLTVEEWLEICKSYGDRCVYCSVLAIPLTIDHIMPLSKGGRHSKENVVPACLSCNIRKNNRVITTRNNQLLLNL